MQRSCDRSVRCFPCADEASNPFANLTTEIPDRNIYAGVVFRRVPNPPLNNWNQDSCVGVCESSISQQDADDCAARNALECIINTQPPPNPQNPSWTPLFCNSVKSAQFGSDCYTILPCTVNAFSVAEANAIAQSLADYRVHDPALTSPCSTTPVPPVTPEPEPEPGPTVTYEKAWNEPARGNWTTSDPCPWPDDYATTWVGGDPAIVCLCNGDNSDPYQWPFGEGLSTDPDSIVTQIGNDLDVVLDSLVLPNTALQENVSSLERLYLRSRIEGGVTGKHVTMQGHWQKPGGSWIERYFNGDTFQFDDFPTESYLRLSFRYDPCSIFQFQNFPGSEPQVNLISAIPESGDVTYEFDVPAGLIYYACVWFESKTHSNGPSMLHLETTITAL